MTKPKFDLIKELEKKKKKEKITFEGATIAFKLPDGNTGTWTICHDTGVRLRLIQECKIQERIIDLSLDEMAKKAFMSAIPMPEPEEKKGGDSYLG